ncbi:MAG: hypothetical protein WCY18_04720 [Methanofastidiosum sp.]
MTIRVRTTPRPEEAGMGTLHMLVTTLPRVEVKLMFVCFSFNLYRLHTPSKRMV